MVKSEGYKNAPMSYFHYETIVPGGVGVKGRIVQPHRSHDAAGDDRGSFTLLARHGSLMKVSVSLGVQHAIPFICCQN